jgi:rubredoxin
MRREAPATLASRRSRPKRRPKAFETYGSHSGEQGDGCGTSVSLSHGEAISFSPGFRSTARNDAVDMVLILRFDEFLKEDFNGTTQWKRPRLGRTGSSQFGGSRWERPAETKKKMHKSDVICPKCNAGYRRLQLFSQKGTAGEFRCRLCDHVLEVLDGSTFVAYRLTVQSERASNKGSPRLADSRERFVTRP